MSRLIFNLQNGALTNNKYCIFWRCENHKININILKIILKIILTVSVCSKKMMKTMGNIWSIHVNSMGI
jgi:hypothetical protein